MHVKKGMLVKVVSGNHKGMEGKILNVFPKKNRVIVEGVNFRKRASRPTQENPSGGFVEREPHCIFLMLWLLIMVRRQE